MQLENFMSIVKYKCLPHRNETTGNLSYILAGNSMHPLQRNGSLTDWTQLLNNKLTFLIWHKNTGQVKNFPKDQLNYMAWFYTSSAERRLVPCAGVSVLAALVCWAHPRTSAWSQGWREAGCSQGLTTPELLTFMKLVGTSVSWHLSSVKIGWNSATGSGAATGWRKHYGIFPDRRTAHRQPGDISFVFLGTKAKSTPKILKIHGANHFITDSWLDLHVF